MDSLLRDIDLALDYLQADPVLVTGTQLVADDVDFFESYRSLRMNYYAALALKARMLLYRGDEQSRNEAYRIGRLVDSQQRKQFPERVYVL
ncbi:MAG: hypothetical protein LUD68_08100 [Rikenellaceae bacterium]|nr:hypothetical protein [Rikenellaceae bacterium]